MDKQMQHFAYLVGMRVWMTVPLNPCLYHRRGTLEQPSASYCDMQAARGQGNTGAWRNAVSRLLAVRENENIQLAERFCSFSAPGISGRVSHYMVGKMCHLVASASWRRSLPTSRLSQVAIHKASESQHARPALLNLGEA